ncbi:MAG: putative peptidoglycan glycosyltransferase FtsW [Firmicutes bacterium]|nr:putative peptidoglycan glycosyltransferase FtsW [Bacillota bacterium]
MRTRSEHPDYILLVVILMLVTIGVMMVYSASFPLSLLRFDHQWHFVSRHLLWALFGVIAMIVASRINYWKWQQLSNVLLASTLLLLLLVFVPGIGVTVQGSTRWIGLGFFNMQPAEVAKIALVLWVAARLAQKERTLLNFWRGTIPIIVVTGIMAALVLRQPDLSTAVVLVLGAGFVLFAGGLPWGQILLLSGLGASALYLGITSAEYRLARFMTFLDPWKDPTDAGYQIIQSLYAIGLGGVFGRGLGASIQKHFFLPDPHNDFVFAVTSEEFGFFGGAVLIALFALLAVRGLRIAIRSPDKFGGFLATGITAMIVAQAFMNIAVVTGSVPVTGITLPLISYGGSSLVIVMGSLGILLNISKYCRE